MLMANFPLHKTEKSTFEFVFYEIENPNFSRFPMDSGMLPASKGEKNSTNQVGRTGNLAQYELRVAIAQYESSKTAFRNV